MESRRHILDNELFTALEAVGHKPEDDVFVWSQGLAFHYQNLLSSLADKVTAAEQDAILKDIWSFVTAKADARVKATLGLEADQDLDRLASLMAAIVSDAEHPAIKGMGDSIEEAILNWVRAFAILDFAMYTFLERHIGSKRCMDIYMGLWETFALANLDHVKAALGITGPEDVDMDKLGEVSRMYWEAIASPYRVTKAFRRAARGRDPDLPVLREHDRHPGHRAGPLHDPQVRGGGLGELLRRHPQGAGGLRQVLLHHGQVHLLRRRRLPGEVREKEVSMATPAENLAGGSSVDAGHGRARSREDGGHGGRRRGGLGGRGRRGT